jgi:hypothetical protein
MTKKSNSDSNVEHIGDHVTNFLRGKIWHANFQADRRQRRLSLKTSSKKQARAMASRIELELQSGSYNQP